MHNYSAFGVCIGSMLPLSGLRPGRGSVDVHVRLRALPPGHVVLDESVSVDPNETRFSWRRAGIFTIRAGREILIEPESGADPSLLRAGVVGPAMAAILQQRGVLALHASVVARRGAAVGFLGVSGSGKSTMAAALQSRGYSFVTDDVAAVVISDRRVCVFPGVPQCKLHEDALAALGDDPASLPVAPGEDAKRVRSVDGPHSAAGLPLAKLYVLAEGDSVRIEPTLPSERFLELVRHSYGVEWMHDVSGPQQFTLRSALAHRVPIRRLVRPLALDLLSQTAAAVERDDDNTP